MPRHTQGNSREDIINLVKTPLGEVNMLAVPREFFSICGHPMLGLMLGQLLYWADRAKRKDGFVYKSYQDWFEEVGASEHYVQKFNKLPFIETKLVKANGSPTTHYRILYDVLREVIGHYMKNHLSKLDGRMSEIDQSPGENSLLDTGKVPDPQRNIPGTLTETTTEINPKITTKRGYPPEINSNPISGSEENAETENEPQTEHRILPNIKEMKEAIAKVIGYNLNIGSLALETRVAAINLIRAGFTPEDVYTFECYWKAHDWRWKKDKQIPTLRNVTSMIETSKVFYEAAQAKKKHG